MNKKKDYRKLFQQCYCYVTSLHYLSANPHTTEDSWPEYMQKQNGSLNEIIRQLQRRCLCEYTAEEGYTITERGYRLMEKHADYIRFFSFGCPYADIVEFEIARRQKPQRDFTSAMLRLLSQKAREYRADGSYEELVNIYADMASLYLAKEQKPRALMYYLRALLIEQSGLLYADEAVNYRRGKLKLPEAQGRMTGIIAKPEIGNGITALKDSYSDDMIEYLYEEETELPYNACTAELLTQMVHDLCDGSYSGLKWQKTFTEEYKKLLA